MPLLGASERQRAAPIDDIVAVTTSEREPTCRSVNQLSIVVTPLPPQPPQVTTMNIMFTQHTKKMIYLPTFWSLSVCELTRTERTKWIVQFVQTELHRAAKMYCTGTELHRAAKMECACTAASSVQKFKVSYFWKLKHCFLAQIFSVEVILAAKF